MTEKKPPKTKDATVQIGDIDSYLGYWLRFVSNQVTIGFQQRLLSKNVTVAEWIVLRFLWSHAPCSPTKLSEVIGIDKGAVSRLLERLVKRNLIKRTPDPTDRRFHSVELTPEGKKLVPELAQIADEHDAYYFQHLSKKEIEGVMKFLKNMISFHNFHQKPID